MRDRLQLRAASSHWIFGAVRLASSFPLVYAAYMRARALGYICIASIPVLYLLLAFGYQPSAATVYTLRDPSYYYLLNTFLLAQGDWSYLYAHPGVSLQLAGAALVWIRWLLLADKAEPMAEELILHHSEYFHAISSAGILLNGALLAGLGLVLLRKKLPLAAILLTQLLFFSAPLWLILFNGLFQAEAVAIALGAAFAALLCMRERPWLQPVFVGFVLATKLNFAVFFVLNFLPPGLKRKGVWFFLSAAVFMVLMVAVYPTWEMGWSHLAQLFLAKGQYTDGGLGIISGSDLWRAVSAQGGEASSVWIALPVVLLLTAFVDYGRGVRLRKRFFLAAGSFLLGIAIYLKKPTHASYLYPALMAYPAVVAAFFLSTRGLRRFWAGFILVALTACWQLSDLPRGLWNFRAFERSNLHAQSFLQNAMDEHQNCFWLMHGTLPLPGDALQMGADWAGGKWFGVLEKAYPRQRWLFPEAKVRHFSLDSLPLHEWVRSLPPEECVVLVVHPDALASLGISPHQVELLSQIPLTALYRWKRP